MRTFLDVQERAFKAGSQAIEAKRREHGRPAINARDESKNVQFSLVKKSNAITQINTIYSSYIVLISTGNKINGLRWNDK